MLGIGAGQLQRVVMVSRVGIEPTTHGLKVRCSTAELPAHGREYTQRKGGIARERAHTTWEQHALPYYCEPLCLPAILTAEP